MSKAKTPVWQRYCERAADARAKLDVIKAELGHLYWSVS